MGNNIYQLGLLSKRDVVIVGLFLFAILIPYILTKTMNIVSIDIIQLGGLLLSFFAGMVFILEDIFSPIHALIFRRLNAGLRHLDNFGPPTLGRETEMAILNWEDEGFLETYKMLKHFSPNIPIPLKRGETEMKENRTVSICIEKSLSFGAQQTSEGITPNPVFVWDTSKRRHHLMSKDALLWYAATYRQRILNRIGFSLLVLSMLIQFWQLFIRFE